MTRLLNRVALIPVAALSLAGCEGPTVPPNTTADIYDYRLMTTPPAVIRWPSGTRVRVYVAGAAGTREDMMSASLARGAAEWNRHAFYGEYELVRATSIRDADVVLRWSDEPSPVDMSECQPELANAVTTFCLSDDDPTRLHVFLIAADNESPGSVRFVITVLGTQSGNPDAVARLVLHELGHVLGIGRHSPDSSDLMSAGVPTRSTLSVADIATVQVLYHTQPHITP
jgi:predicted Zn-dependent protease